MDARERVSMWPLAIAALVMGVAPMLWLHSINPSVSAALKQFSTATQPATPVPATNSHAPGPPLRADVAPNLSEVPGR
jgi:hypothetical protein